MSDDVVYMPDAQVFDLLLNGDPRVIAEVRAAKARGVRFVVPAQVNVELRQGAVTDNDRFRVAAKLALARDLGMEFQDTAVNAAHPRFIPDALKDEYFKRIRR